MCLAVFLYLLLHLPSLIRSGSFSRMPEVFEPEPMNYYTLSRFMLWILSVFRNPTLNHLPLSESKDSLLCDLIALTPGLAFFLPKTRTLAVALPFSSAKSYSSMKFLLSLSLSSFGPYSDYLGVNISINNSFLSFFNVYALFMLAFDE